MIETRDIDSTSNWRVSIIGFGLMGSQISQVFALHGFRVIGQDVDPNQLVRGMNIIRNGRYGLESSVAKGRISAQEAEEAISRITTTTSLDEALLESDFMLEAVIERLEIKREIFRRAGEISSKQALLATNTSTLSIAKIAQGLPANTRSRIFGMHFFNPPQIMKLVEIVKTDETDEGILKSASVVATKLGKTSIMVKDIPGFVANRIGILVFSEASSLLEKGIATVQDIDNAMKLGYGYPLGPFELGDLVGLDTRLRNMQALYEETKDERFKPPSLLRTLVSEGYLGDPKLRKGSKGGYYEFFGLKRHSD